MIVSSDRVSSSFVFVVLTFSFGFLLARISASVVTIGGIVVPGSAVGTSVCCNDLGSPFHLRRRFLKYGLIL